MPSNAARYLDTGVSFGEIDALTGGRIGTNDVPCPLYGPRAMTAAEPVSASPSLLDVFRARCEARALLVREYEMELHDAVDGLQLAAEAYELVHALGQDAV
jgi:hypothetical protein